MCVEKPGLAVLALASRSGTVLAAWTKNSPEDNAFVLDKETISHWKKFKL